MIRCDCVYDDSDEDCYKCVKHGYVLSCEGCKDYETLFDRAKKSIEKMKERE